MSVVVVGGGPAGLATAAALAREGVRVVVLEAGRIGRPKLCGEFLSPDADAALDGIGLAGLADRLGAPVLRGVRATSSRRGRKLVEWATRLEAPGRGVSRQDLDAALAGAARGAGAEVREGCRATSVDTDAEPSCVVRTSAESMEGIGCDAVVLASGRLAGPGPADRAEARWVAGKVHVRLLRALGDATELHFVDGAYVGLAEVTRAGERVVNVCALARRDAWERAGGTLEGLFERLAAESPPFAERWRGARPEEETRAAAAGFGFRPRRPRGDGARPALLVGDAAALIAPLCGDGQAMALTGGAAVARILAARVRGGRLDAEAVRGAAREWERRFRAACGARLRLGRGVQSAALRPLAAASVLRALRVVRPAGRWMFRATRGPYPGPGVMSGA